MRARHGMMAVIALLLWLPEANAIGPDGKYIAKGFGTTSCGTWTKDRGQDDVASYAEQNWVLGWVSAYNAYVWKLSSDIASGTDNEGLAAWIDMYCGSHPLDDIADASLALMIELTIRSMSKVPAAAR